MRPASRQTGRGFKFLQAFHQAEILRVSDDFQQDLVKQKWAEINQRKRRLHETRWILQISHTTPPPEQLIAKFEIPLNIWRRKTGGRNILKVEEEVWEDESAGKGDETIQIQIQAE